MKRFIKAILDLLHWVFIKPVPVEDFEDEVMRLHEREALLFDERMAETLPERPAAISTESNALRVMQTEISWRVAAGYDNRESIVFAAVNEALIETGLPKLWLEEHASRLTDASLRFHLKMQNSWLEETDCDRLDEAFAELDRAGIVARQNYQCCITCGREAIWEQIRAAEVTSIVRDSAPTIGYVFFHQRDTEEAVRNNQLHLTFGSTKAETFAGEETKHIAKLVIQTLGRYGFDVRWNGELNSRIHIENLQWQYRRLERWGEFGQPETRAY